MLCVVAVQLIYGLIDKKILEFFNKFLEVRKIPGLGILLVLVSLYLIGLIVSNILGRQLFKLIETITQRIPFIKSIYGVGKHLSQTFSVDGSEKTFKKAVLVKIDQKECWIPAFVMSSVENPKTKEELFFVFIATAPNPVSGFVIVVKSSQIIDPGWTVEEGLKIILSLGIIAPKDIKLVS